MTLAQSLGKVGWLVRDLRQAIGWSQRELARRADVSQALVSAIENGRVGNVSMATLARLFDAMGAELVIDANRPFLGDRKRQRDPAHVHCTNQVVRRLQRAGWLTATEVEVGGNRSRGWIDVLAWHPGTGVLLVIEVKTEIHDLGGIERTLGWYERESWAAARRLGWRPRKVVGTLILLATEVNETRLRDNREAIARGFPIRAASLVGIVAGSNVSGDRARAMAMIDPRSKRQIWLRSARIDGRRTPAPYAHYADFMSHVNPTRESARRSA
jgi:transcriptional regulator with XRE-family HTH domain